MLREMNGKSTRKSRIAYLKNLVYNTSLTEDQTGEVKYVLVINIFAEYQTCWSVQILVFPVLVYPISFANMFHLS